jgi:hypothetical protein
MITPFARTATTLATRLPLGSPRMPPEASRRP